MSIENDIRRTIEKTFKENIENLEVLVHEGNKKGEGYIGEVKYISLKNKKTSEEYNLAIKKVPVSDNETTSDFLKSCYLSEIHFYTKIWPELKNFQKKFPESTQFEVAPKCYGISNIPGKEILLLENLKVKKYGIHPGREPLSDAIYEKLFTLYAKYHALSFAFKHYQPEKFYKLAVPLQNNFYKFRKTALCNAVLEETIDTIKDILEDTKEEHLLRKMKPFIENGYDLYCEGMQYIAPQPIISHGDSRSNNLLFKYNNSNKLEDIKLIDWQMSNLASPVHDISYILYSSANKETLRNYEKFLKIYHDNLGIYLNEYDLNINDIYPYEILIEEWKNHTLGEFMFSLLVLGAKYIEEENTPGLDNNEGGIENKIISKTDEYMAAVYDLVQYYCDNCLS